MMKMTSADVILAAAIKRCGIQTTARTRRGRLRALQRAGGTFFPPTSSPDPAAWRAWRDQREAAWLAGHARAAAHAAFPPGDPLHGDLLAGGLLLAGLPPETVRREYDNYTAHIRLRAGVGPQHPVILVPGNALRRAGALASHRWRGRWKTAPGSYQPSTRRAEVGIEWLRALVAHGGVARYRGPGGGIYVRHPALTWHGWRAHVCATRADGPGWLILGPDGYGYHAVAASPRAAIHEALRAARARRKTVAVQAQIRENLSRIWVTREDSIRAGHCPTGTASAARAIEAALGAPPESIGAVRADWLWQHRRGDAWAQRAIVAAARRQGLVATA